MPPTSTARRPAATQWPVWSTIARLVVTDPAALSEAYRLVISQLRAVEQAASRFRPDSEVSRLQHAGGQPQQVSPLLAELVGAALVAAERTGGDVDPTIGRALVELGYQRDFTGIPKQAGSVRVAVRPAPGWQRVQMAGQWLTVPPDVLLDLGATAKAVTADRCAEQIARRFGVGVLVSLGGDIATAGPGPDGGWQVRVEDHPSDRACRVALPAGAAIATSSTVSRQWRRGDRVLHHVLNPRTCQPAQPVWRSVTVAAYSCLYANTLTTAALVRGLAAPGWLRELSMPARLVTASREVVRTPNWPADSTS